MLQEKKQEKNTEMADLIKINEHANSKTYKAGTEGL